MAMFNSYVKLPEGNQRYRDPICSMVLVYLPTSGPFFGGNYINVGKYTILGAYGNVLGIHYPLSANC